MGIFTADKIRTKSITTKVVFKLETKDRPLDQIEFGDLLNKYKPTELYHGSWSQKHPFIFLRNWEKDGVLPHFDMYGAAPLGKEGPHGEPRRREAHDLYQYLKYQGLEECYFFVPSFIQRIKNLFNGKHR